MGGPRRIEMGSLGVFVGIILTSATAAPGFGQNPDLYDSEPVAVNAAEVEPDRVPGHDTPSLPIVLRGAKTKPR